MATREEFVRTLLAVAQAEVGVKESGGANWGPRVKEYLAAVSIGFPAAWCAAYNRWCLVQTCKALELPLDAVPILTEFSARSFASCSAVGNYARDEGILYKAPRPGDLFLVPSAQPGRFRHTGIVVSTGTGRFVGCEGNTNTDGSAEGYGVFKRTRTVKPGYRFVRFLDHFQLDAAGSPAADPPKPYSLYWREAEVARMPVVEGRAVVPIRVFAKEILGLTDAEIAWDAAEHEVLLRGQPVETRLFMMNGANHASIRALAAEFDLTLSVDGARRRVTLAPEPV